MPIPSFRFPPSSTAKPRPSGRQLLRGQVLVIFAVAMLTLLFFVGLAIDAGSLYVTYNHLKRAVDAAAVAAANQYKRGETHINKFRDAATEVLELNNVDMSVVDLEVHICDEDGNSEVDNNLPEDLGDRCEETSFLRKLVWVKATQHAPLYFLGLLGFGPVPLTTQTISEAAAVDIVLVLDVSESMSSQTSGYVVNDYDPDTQCNPNTRTAGSTPPSGACLPMWYLKNAAHALINTIYKGYDRIAIITYDSRAEVKYVLPPEGEHGSPSEEERDSSSEEKKYFTSEKEVAWDALWNDVNVHDDPPYARMWAPWGPDRDPGDYAFNPVNPEDRDGDGRDTDDDLALYGVDCPWVANPAALADRWWSVDEGAPDLFGWGGVPCDHDAYLDAYDWNSDDIFTMDDHNASLAYLAKFKVFTDLNGNPIRPSLSPLSTCIGCGLRVANELLTKYGRRDAIWVVVVFTDGVANLSDTPPNAATGPGDTPYTGGSVPAVMKSGFCNGHFADRDAASWWQKLCIDRHFTPRYCVDTNSATCPPGSTPLVPALRSYTYSVTDYARDMADSIGLTKSTNSQEPLGTDVAMYVVGYGAVNLGEPLLRYIAAVGEDGDRTTDPCNGVSSLQSCGNYFYTHDAAQLQTIFEDIASRIYTRINQ